ncbi:hypothetical protein FF38_08277 [Lucilia cuprina]|uniref:Uncharacterized protein n=1 Tax=Lucilia cuprina TaxID=7375 RepID=A0A0L0CH78_LUCCU|nr:hypothetical protein FF38_08277 [Lucilia cuprina]
MLVERPPRDSIAGTPEDTAYDSSVVSRGAYGQGYTEATPMLKGNAHSGSETNTVATPVEGTSSCPTEPVHTGSSLGRSPGRWVEKSAAGTPAFIVEFDQLCQNNVHHLHMQQATTCAFRFQNLLSFSAINSCLKHSCLKNDYAIAPLCLKNDHAIARAQPLASCLKIPALSPTLALVGTFTYAPPCLNSPPSALSVT